MLFYGLIHLFRNKGHKLSLATNHCTHGHNKLNSNVLVEASNPNYAQPTMRCIAPPRSHSPAHKKNIGLMHTKYKKWAAFNAAHKKVCIFCFYIDFGLFFFHQFKITCLQKSFSFVFVSQKGKNIPV